MQFLPICVFLAFIASAHSHGYLKEPVARTSIQLRPEFNTQQPYWWDHQGVWCGNVQQDVNFSTCGRCGDSPGGSDANQNGIYDKKVIVANYTAGSTIQVVSEYGAQHYGQIHIELCPAQVETDNCFQTLAIVGGSEAVENNKMCVTGGDLAAAGDNTIQDYTITTTVKLPDGVKCSRCTLRWTYRTHYPGQPYDPQWYPCKLNTYPAQTFRNCADVAIN